MFSYIVKFINPEAFTIRMRPLLELYDKFRPSNPRRIHYFFSNDQQELYYQVVKGDPRAVTKPLELLIVSGSYQKDHRVVENGDKYSENLTIAYYGNQPTIVSYESNDLCRMRDTLDRLMPDVPEDDGIVSSPYRTPTPLEVPATPSDIGKGAFRYIKEKVNAFHGPLASGEVWQMSLRISKPGYESQFEGVIGDLLEIYKDRDPFMYLSIGNNLVFSSCKN